MDVEQAWKARNSALKNLRFLRAIEHYKCVLDTDEDLVQAVAEKRAEPPNPIANFTYQGIAYTLQSYTDGNARYVPLEKFNPAEYIFQPISKVEIVRKEISVKAQVEYELEILKEYFPELSIESL